MVDADDCPYCARFHAEIGPAYPNTTEGKLAPLQVLNVKNEWPKAYKHIEQANITPTFILIDKGKEVDRLEGYPGEDYFWFLLNGMLDKIEVKP